ncbi:hypothetical protein WH52_14525 [Tenacibaculum holothuriorum]|uniref:N-acetyltransferase domain-containing protein n=1 Tax=Tenacibaculum holothuriorum TaxID=1635173 RepID=A0A1Y2P8R4_9FLAO|nr:GNAT family N-acetyltransferase [Tenacibaculum holothuriorum]OSY86832.1 hypothetical protein WH52_14525 [Tenacibaculum holothuriorum]
MQIRRTTLKDLPELMRIFNYAQRYLASLNIDQWQDGYPDGNRILTDIENKESFVVENEQQDIIATFMFTTTSEPTYNEIDGGWVTSVKAKYGVIHRIAAGENCTIKGIGSKIINHCEAILKEQKVGSLRIDTHKDNLGMQHILKKLQYQYCGIITLKGGATRLAFEKLV